MLLGVLFAKWLLRLCSLLTVQCQLSMLGWQSLLLNQGLPCILYSKRVLLMLDLLSMTLCMLSLLGLLPDSQLLKLGMLSLLLLLLGMRNLLLLMLGMLSLLLLLLGMLSLLLLILCMLSLRLLLLGMLSLQLLLLGTPSRMLLQLGRLTLLSVMDAKLLCLSRLLCMKHSLGLLLLRLLTLLLGFLDHSASLICCFLS